MDIAICTIEKANSLLNRVIEENIFFDISFFIIDEFHLVSLVFKESYIFHNSSYSDENFRFWMKVEGIS